MQEHILMIGNSRNGHLALDSWSVSAITGNIDILEAVIIGIGWLFRKQLVVSGGAVCHYYTYVFHTTYNFHRARYFLIHNILKVNTIREIDIETETRFQIKLILKAIITCLDPFF